MHNQKNVITLEKLITEINDLKSVLNPLDCINSITKMFFNYVGETVDQTFANELQTEEIEAIHKLLYFLQSIHKDEIIEGNIDLLFPAETSAPVRSGLTKIFFHSLKKHWSSGKKYTLELTDVQNMEILFDQLNMIEEIRISA